MFVFVVLLCGCVGLCFELLVVGLCGGVCWWGNLVVMFWWGLG